MDKLGFTGIDLAIILIFVIGLVKGFFHGQGAVNRIFGVLWGAVKAIILIMVLAALLGFLDSQFNFLSKELVDKSFIYSFMLQLAYLTWDGILSLFGK